MCMRLRATMTSRLADAHIRVRAPRVTSASVRTACACGELNGEAGSAPARACRIRIREPEA